MSPLSISISRLTRPIASAGWWQFRIRLVLDRKQLAPVVIVHRHCVDVGQAVDKRSRDRCKSGKLLQRQIVAQELLDGILDEVALRGQLLELDLLVGPPAFAIAHVQQQQQRQHRHDEHRNGVDDPTAKTVAFHHGDRTSCSRLSRVVRGLENVNET